MPAMSARTSPLTAEEVGCGVCVTGKYDDQAISSGVGVDGKREFANLAEAIGKAYIMDLLVDQVRSGPDSIYFEI